MTDKTDDMPEEIMPEEILQKLEWLWTKYAEHGGLPLDDLQIIQHAHDELQDLQNVFDSTWKANQRGIKAWQEKTGKTNTWPDQANMVEFLMDEIDNHDSVVEKLEAENERLREALKGVKKIITPMVQGMAQQAGLKVQPRVSHKEWSEAVDAILEKALAGKDGG